MPATLLKNPSPITIGKAKFDFSKTYLIGIVNITPDSFSDGNRYLDPNNALKQIEKLIKDGADIIDIGAESSHPGANQVSEEEELKRLTPILKQYKKNFDTPLSLDTTKAKVAEIGLSLGVDLINDISSLTQDPDIASIIAKYNCPVILMHMKGTPQTMQVSPKYENVIDEIINALKNSISLAKKNKINKIIIDPGIGFGKTLNHNLEILKNLSQFKSLGYPILIGASNKSFIGDITGDPVSERLEGTISSNIIALINGANFLRIHDVKAVKKAVLIADAVLGVN